MSELAPLVGRFEASREAIGDVARGYAVPQRVRVLDVHQGLVDLLPRQLLLLVATEVGLADERPHLNLLVDAVLLIHLKYLKFK